jgi:hypothetical protein
MVGSISFNRNSMPAQLTGVTPVETAMAGNTLALVSSLVILMPTGL